MKPRLRFTLLALAFAVRPATGAPSPGRIQVAPGPGNELSLEWSGAGGIYQVQRRSGFERGAWTDLHGCLTRATSANIPFDGVTGFFRIVDLSAGQPVVFAGGTLNNLRSLSSTLTFNHLIIDGPLRLPLASSPSLQVTHLTLTAAGSLGDDRSPCEHGPAPSLTIRATGRVVLGGQISLNGESGDRVTDTATCNSCYGRDGGNLDVEAAEIAVTGTVTAHGGSGGTLVSSLGGSSGCSAGDGGLIRLSAGRISIAQSAIETSGGRGGIGYYQGQENRGSDGEPGEIRILSTGQLRIHESELRVDGAATVTATEADVASPIYSGSLQATIGGSADLDPPDVEILHPRSGGQFPINAPLEVLIEARDTGAGIKELQVTGLGYSRLHPAGEMIDGVLTVRIEKPAPPAVLTVTAIDNNGNQRTRTASNLRLTGNLTIPSNTEYFLAGDLDLGPGAALVIQGTMAIAKGSHPIVRAHSLTIASSGRIVAQAPTNELELAQSAALTFNLQGTVAIQGLVDFSGRPSLPGRDYDLGQPGGNLTVSAAAIEIAGSINVNGGLGDAYPYGWPAQYIRQGGADAGTVRLTALNSITVTGSLTAEGGNSEYASLGPTFPGGDGGRILLIYGQQANLADAVSLSVRGGTNIPSGSNPGQTGVLGTLKRAPSPPRPEDFLAANEIEPNGTPATAAETLFPIVAVFRADTYDVVANGLIENRPETMDEVILEPADYLIGVWAYDRRSAPAPAYRLRLVPLEFP